MSEVFLESCQAGGELLSHLLGESEQRTRFEGKAVSPALLVSTLLNDHNYRRRFLA